ncbi:MAG: ATP-binding protein [Bacteroidales bacterium]|nr:ATP-binding protein [Bacteroidales bacterium]
MQRNLYEQLKLHLDKKEFIILTGARQTGKSTLLRQLEAHCKNIIGVPCIFLNLENKNILSELNKSPLNLLNYLSTTTEKTVVLIDEVQYLNDPTNFLKLLYDEHRAQLKIVATGSSAFYLDKKFKDSLAGRKKVFRLLTCSFDEYLRLSGNDELLGEIERLRTNPKAKTLRLEYLRNEWENYMIYGGYPAVATEPDRHTKSELLCEIRDSYIKRDVLEAGVQNETAFYQLFRIIANQSGNILNINELSATLRIKNETVENYIALLQKCFHITLVKPFFRNLRKELTKMPKVYMLDVGLRNCLLNNFQPLAIRPDKGDIWENVYFRTLADKYSTDDVYYWRTADQNEVDFVLPYPEQPYAVEVKYGETAIKTSKYKKFTENYPDIPLHFAYIEPFTEDFFRKIIPT